jgi:hypothetical protein
MGERLGRALEYEFLNSVWRVTGVSPERYELVLCVCVHADTKVFPDSLTRMVSCMVCDEEIMMLCGETTTIANKAETSVTMMQGAFSFLPLLLPVLWARADEIYPVFEYYMFVRRLAPHHHRRGHFQLLVCVRCHGRERSSEDGFGFDRGENTSAHHLLLSPRSTVLDRGATRMGTSRRCPCHRRSRTGTRVWGVEHRQGARICSFFSLLVRRRM